MADHAQQNRDEERSKEREKCQVARRQQDVQDGRGERPVDGRDQELLARERQTRQWQGKAVKSKGLRPNDRRKQVGPNGEHEDPTDRCNQLVSGQAISARQRTDDEAQSAEGEQTEPKRDGVAENNPRELFRRDAPSGIEPVSHRRARQHGEPDVMRDRVRQKRRAGDVPSRQHLADVLERQQVVAGQDHVVHGCQGEREQQE